METAKPLGSCIVSEDKDPAETGRKLGDEVPYLIYSSLKSVSPH